MKFNKLIPELSVADLGRSLEQGYLSRFFEDLENGGSHSSVFCKKLKNK